MLNEKELLADRPCQLMYGVKQPCSVVISHAEALVEIERLNGKILVAKAVYDKFKHLDRLFSDEAWLANNAISQALADAWTAIKLLAGGV